MNEKVDNLLREWANEKAPSDQHLHELTGQIGVKAASVNYSSGDQDLPVDIPFRFKLQYAGLGVAAAVLLMFGLQFMGSGDEGSAFATISCAKVEISRKLFRDMKEMFPESLRWVAESNGDINMGVEAISGGVTESAEPMLVRFSVVARTRGDKVWKSIWNTDIMLRGEELAEIAPGRDGNEISLWVYSLSDGKIAVDSKLALDIPVRLALQKESVMEPGKPVELLSMTEDDVEYKVFQTVRTLDDNA